MSSNQKINVSSEIGVLKRVMVHRPDAGIARISPKDAEELLFDDIVHLPTMQKEHEIFTEILEAFMGKENVLEIQDLLLEALKASKESKAEMIDLILDYEELPATYKDIFHGLSDEDLATVLAVSYTHLTLPTKRIV